MSAFASRQFQIIGNIVSPAADDKVAFEALLADLRLVMEHYQIQRIDVAWGRPFAQTAQQPVPSNTAPATSDEKVVDAPKLEVVKNEPEEPKS